MSETKQQLFSSLFVPSLGKGRSLEIASLAAFKHSRRMPSLSQLGRIAMRLGKRDKRDREGCQQVAGKVFNQPINCILGPSSTASRGSSTLATASFATSDCTVSCISSALALWCRSDSHHCSTRPYRQPHWLTVKVILPWHSAMYIRLQRERRFRAHYNASGSTRPHQS